MDSDDSASSAGPVITVLFDGQPLASVPLPKPELLPVTFMFKDGSTPLRCRVTAKTMDWLIRSWGQQISASSVDIVHLNGTPARFFVRFSDLLYII